MQNPTSDLHLPRSEKRAAPSTLKSQIPELLKKYESDILNEWMKEQAASLGRRPDLIKESQLKEESSIFYGLLRKATQTGTLFDINTANWDEVRDFLGNLSRSRSTQGFSPSETATFVFSIRQPLFNRIRKEFEANSSTMAEEFGNAALMLDQLGLFTTEVYQKAKEEQIRRQQQDMLELSTPVVQLWDGILALPMIGTLDSSRTQVVMETLLQKIVETESQIAIIDITGVPTVDTLVAQHLLKTVTAARLMGAECIISGIRPQIAATIVHLGVDLGNVITKATLRDAFVAALRKSGSRVGKTELAN
jgi:rsbT co-antagonist protein RsbR